MRIETYIPGLSKNTIEIVKHAESLGYDALVSGELNNEPFLPVLLGLEHSKKMICIGLKILKLHIIINSLMLNGLKVAKLM